MMAAMALLAVVFIACVAMIAGILFVGAIFCRAFTVAMGQAMQLSLVGVQAAETARLMRGAGDEEEDDLSKSPKLGLLGADNSVMAAAARNADRRRAREINANENAARERGSYAGDDWEVEQERAASANGRT